MSSADWTPPECPKCGKPMERKMRRSDGHAFWGCSGFPICRATQDAGRDQIHPADYRDEEGDTAAYALMNWDRDW